jgi:hypothetical protein
MNDLSESDLLWRLCADLIARCMYFDKEWEDKIAEYLTPPEPEVSDGKQG